MFRSDKNLTEVPRGLFLAVAVLVLLGVAGVAPLLAQPRADIPVTVQDFGQVWDYQTLKHVYVVRNSGDKELRILEVDPDCACTVANYDRVIPPGGEGKVNLELQPFSVLRAFEKKTYVRFNDPSRPGVNLIMKGVAQRSLEILPSHVVRLRGSSKDNLAAQVRFVSNLPFPWEITKFATNIPDKIDVALRVEKPGKIYVVEVKNKYREQGHYLGNIEVFTNSVQKPRIIVRVIADLYPDSAVSP